MILFIDGVCQEVPYTNLPYWQKDVETACEELTSLVAEGWTLERALLVDGHSRVELPVAVFDGQSFQKPIKRLQQQWQQILAKSPASAPRQPMTWSVAEVLQRQIQREKHYIRRLIEAIGRLEQISHQTRSIPYSESTRYRIYSRHQTMLILYKSQLSQAQVTYQRNVDRFKRTIEYTQFAA